MPNIKSVYPSANSGKSQKASSTTKIINLIRLKIIATSQTSRFHVDTLTTLSQEVDLHQVNISVGSNDLLLDAHLRLKAGVHYTLIGRNGEGKSTLLKAISNRLIPGIPDNLCILLVSQVQEKDSGAEYLLAEGEQLEPQYDDFLSVTERVVKSDRRLLLKAHESPESTAAIANAVFSVRFLRARDQLEEARKIAQRRSGTRGSEARKLLLKAEATVAEYEMQIKNASTGISDIQISLDAAELLTDVQNTLDALDASTTEARARSILLGLGFSQAQLDTKFITLSGGWRSRCSLANALLQQPDLLMLDEPTNYLDIMSVIWLQKYLADFSSTVVVVAHDREFIDAIAQETIVLRNKVLSYFDGNMTDWERHAKNDRKGKLRMKESLDKKRNLIEKSIDQGARSARKTGDENRARMVKSRQKKLDDRWGLEKSDKGTRSAETIPEDLSPVLISQAFRFKLNRDMGFYHLTSRRDIEIEDLDKPIKLLLPSPEKMRFPGALIAANNISFAYPGSANLLNDVSLTIHPGGRVGLVGRNGEGKSTLVRLLIGIGDMHPQMGTIERHPRLRLGYFDQHSVEQLSSSEIEHVSALEYFITQLRKIHAAVEIDESSGRACLGSFGLHGRAATNPINTLSGGQKVRLALALVVYPAPDLLILDEVTTHLDKDTVVALIHALHQYNGAILLVTHDRHFMRCVIEGAPILPPARNGNDEQEYDEEDESDDEDVGRTGMVYSVGPKGRVELLSGGTNDYVSVVEKQMKKLGLS